MRTEGHTAAREGDEPFGLQYVIDVDDRWHTRFVRVLGRSTHGSRAATLESDGSGRWRLDGRDQPSLDGCFDVDLEASAFTNALPVHRLCLAPRDHADVPAAYVRAATLAVSRLEQRYRRVDNGTGPERYDYEAPAFDYRCRLAYDDTGLVLEYPGLAVRADP